MPSFRVADKFLYSKCGAVNMCTGVICSRVGTGDIAEASRVNWGTKVLQGRVKKAEQQNGLTPCRLVVCGMKIQLIRKCLHSKEAGKTQNG